MLLLTVREAVQMYIFFWHHFGVSMISQHFSPTNLYPNIVMIEVHPPFFEPYGGVRARSFYGDAYVFTWDGPFRAYIFPQTLLWFLPPWGVVLARKDMEVVSSTPIQFHMDNDVVVGMPPKGGKWFHFLLGLASL